MHLSTQLRLKLMTENRNERRRDQDLRFMRDALALGWRQQGLTSPNPAVGSVIVRHDGDVPVVVGRGATQPGGRPHGEPIALAQAGAAAHGATLYVTLEPCSHHGRAGPCSDAIIAAGVGRVVSAIEDPDPRVAGQGHARMRAAGIDVDVGIGADEAARAHRGHLLRVTKGRPAVTLKLARTRDGYAGRRGGRVRITGEAANAQVHLMRAHADAIMVGVGTVLADDPQLTVRLPGMEGRSPVRVIVDSRLSTPPSAALVQSAREVPTWIVTTDIAPAEAEQRLAGSGVEIVRVGADEGRVSLPQVLAALAQLGVARVFAEGGPLLAASLIRHDLVDEAVVLTGPGNLSPDDDGGIVAVLPELALALADAERFRLRDSGRWGTGAGADHFDIFERFF